MNGVGTKAIELLVLGTDHRSQISDPMLKQMIETLCRQYGVMVVAEEICAEARTVGREVAEERGIGWLPVDMSAAERIRAGIHSTLCKRPAVEFDPATGWLSEHLSIFGVLTGFGKTTG